MNPACNVYMLNCVPHSLFIYVLTEIIFQVSS